MANGALKDGLRWLLALLMIGGGINHFAMPAVYEAMMPTWLPAPAALVAISGVFEILGGAGLLLAPVRRWAAWGIVALLIAVFPANLNMALHHLPLGSYHPPSWALWARLPLQAVLIAWGVVVHAPAAARVRKDNMYRLHIANKNYSSWSLRPWVLMREHGIPFEEVLTPFAGAATAATFRKFSPNSRVPCLLDGDRVIWESLAIVEYLAERHPGVWPADAGARAFARSAAAEMHAGFTALRLTCSMSCGVRVQLREVSAGLRADLARLSELWNEGLERFGGPFLAGPTFTAMDAFFAPVAFRAQTYDLAFTGAAAAVPARLLALPSMREWYAAALQERWRDEDDEARIAAAGTVTADLRAAP